MPWSLEIRADLTFVDVVYYGEMTARDLQEATTAAIRVEKEQGLNKFLIDMERFLLSPTASLFEILEITARQYIDQEADRDGRVAMYASEASAAREAMQFYEDAAVNRGWMVKVFSEREEALQWLLQDDPNASP